MDSCYRFPVDASQAGEGNLEITISARGHNIPTQVHPQGNARFTVSFVPIEPSDHVISINFNKESVPGSPFLARIQGDSPHQILVSGPSLTAAGVGKTSYFTMSNVAGSVEDIEVNVEARPHYKPNPTLLLWSLPIQCNISLSLLSPSLITFISSSISSTLPTYNLSVYYHTFCYQLSSCSVF
uniref:Uncharacterized protein n=1 Tax=Timema douglasi TaxID=61478 RepID=A0A7R8VXT9_TIMDO|nr:unnamed protein product [Timema douglasi]